MKRIVSIFLSLLLIPAFSFCQTSTDCSAVTIVSATNNGTNTVATYFEANGIRNGNDYYGSTIYYPQNTTSILASIIIIPGYATYESSMQNWGPFLASHGIVCMTIGTNSIFDLVNARKEALQDALISLKAENTRINSPLFNKLDTNRVALGGWSMGGGGAQLAAVEDSTIKAIIALCPWIDPAQITINLLNHNTPILFFSGQIDNLSFWDYPLDSSEIQENINSPLSGEGLVAHYKFNQGPDGLLPQTLIDYSGNQNHGTINGDIAWVENIEGCTDELAEDYNPDANVDDGNCYGYPENGDYGLHFDGVDDYVEINNSNLFKNLSSLTFEAVVYINDLGDSAIGDLIDTRIISDGWVELGYNDSFNPFLWVYDGGTQHYLDSYHIIEDQVEL